MSTTKSDLSAKSDPSSKSDLSAMSGLYTKGTLVWVENKDDVWRCARLKTDFKPGDGQLVTEDIEDAAVEVVIKIDLKSPKLPHLRNPDILLGANDLTTLSYLHEPAVLYNLRIRFLNQRAIYTWCGIVLVAVNPFSDLDIYGEETIQTYHSQLSTGSTTQLDPHIYAVAEDAFSKLERESRNQSIIVSGESGAGKTVSAKFAMRYFASIAGSTSSNIENRVLASNPIMESIGNAKTTRNDNSSRFGKYIQIMFDPYTRSIVGGNMRTYLLEKSRVTRQSEGERNFHIFYQVVNFAKKGSNRELCQELRLDHQFSYLGGRKSSDDDISRFIEAMVILGFHERQQNIIMKIIAAILHAGNISFHRSSDEECAIDPNDLHLKTFCSLLGIDVSACLQWLTHRVLRTGMKEVIVTPVTVDVAESGRDALAKFIYEKTFSWIVGLINKSLGVATSIKESSITTFIGVLDIYGFEHFEINSFEQFCINYANEVLQQQFNQHVFKLEQEEYVKEGIDWTMIDFTDNQPVIDLIEAKLGILSLLDEECKMPKGSDETWCAKLYSQLRVNEIFQKPKIGSRTCFIIQHFADRVTYTVDEFLEKNRDTVWEEQIDLLRRPESAVQCIFQDEDSIENVSIVKPGGGKTKISASVSQSVKQSKQAKATVGSQFRESLSALMKTLNATTPHYVRCIKSNDDKAAFEFDNQRAVQQLRACGVLETIRISSNGFPSRWTYQDFSNRYRVLLVGVSRFFKRKQERSGQPPVPLPRKLVKAGSASATEVKAVCEQIVKVVYELQVYSQFKLPFEPDQSSDSSKSLNQSSDSSKSLNQSSDSSKSLNQSSDSSKSLYQFGKSKIFFRSGQVALLERIRTQRLRECAILIQKIIKGFIYRRRYLRIKESVLLLQTQARAYLARKRFWILKCTKAATVIQKEWRCHSARQRFLHLRRTAVGLQRFGRGLLARKRFEHIQKDSAASLIQRVWRGYQARRVYRKKIRQIILVQSCIRRHYAKKELKQLKIEAKSVAHVQQLNKGLEKKIIELQQKLNESIHELKDLKKKEAVLVDTKQDVHKLDIEIKNLKNHISDLEKDKERMREEIESRDKYNASLEKKISDQMKSLEKLKEINVNLSESIDKRAVEEAVAEREKNLEVKFEQERNRLLGEIENEKSSYQQLLRKYADLEDQMESSRGDQQLNGDDHSNGHRSGHDVSTVSLMMKCSELEQECAKLKQENQEMRNIFADVAGRQDADSAASLLAQQCASMQSELDRTREEKTHLKTIVLGQESSLPGSRRNENESEVISAFKMIVKQLERELDEEKNKSLALKSEVNLLKKDNDRQQHLIGLTSNSLAESGNDEYVTRISQENLLLREKNERLNEEVKKMRVEMMRQKMLENGTSNYSNIDLSDDTNLVDQSGKSYLGMFKFAPQKEQLLLDILITNLEPIIALKLPPHFPATILFMCIRYTDEVNDDKQVRSLLNNAMVTMKRTVKRGINNNNVEVLVLWLANSVKLIILLKQYSGEEVFGELPESLKNFDLSEYRQLFSDIAIWIFQGVIKLCEERLQPLIVPAVLEYEGLASSGICSQPTVNRSGSVSNEDDPGSPEIDKPVDALIKELSYLHRILLLHAVEGELISQIFKQMFYFICAGALNNLLLRKDLCHWNKAMQIRFNLSSLEQWCREQQIPKCNEIVEKLDPIIQATKLLQTKKTEEHIPTIVEMCYKLTSGQIMKILILYTCGDEEEISPAFIKKIKKHLGDQRKEPANIPLLMNTKHAFPITIPYNPSDVDFRKITLPPPVMKRGIGTVLTKV